MRYLNKLVFINSATIPYAEVMVNGNVHLIGTQGVGKSTLLRAILFFYNADTLKLGISREKKSFAEYYFPYQNSYIIYEVMRETGPYCIMAFKSQGKVCYRFFDAPYHQKFLISATGQAYQKFDEVRSQLDFDGILYSRKIDRYEEYRDILYGNNEAGKKEFSRYALLQSKQYQNIPRTIQNVFLNSKLDAEFIKQTIIMSLNEEDISIDLQKYSHHLRNFQEQLEDIRKYKLPVVQKLAENIIKYQQAITYLDKEKNTLAAQITWAVANLNRQIPRTEEKLQKATAEKNAAKQKMENAETRHRQKMERLRSESGVLESELKKAKQKTDYYEKIGIASLLQRIHKKKDHEAQVKSLQKEQGILTQKFGEVAQKYDAILAAIDNDLVLFRQTKEREKLEAKTNCIQEERNIRRLAQQNIAEIKQINQESEEQAQSNLEQQKQLLNTEQIRRAETRHKRFFDTEIADLKLQLLDLKFDIQQYRQSIENLRTRQETTQKQWELDEAKHRQDITRNFEQLETSILQTNRDIQAIDEKLAAYDNALYGWLNEHAKGWENTIGKVIDDKVLFSPDLSPAPHPGNASFYGVSIQLGELPVKVKSLEAYKLEKKMLEDQLHEYQKEQNNLQQQLNENLEKTRKKYQPILKDCKQQLDEQEYRQQRDDMQLKQLQIQLKDLEWKAKDEQQKALAFIDLTIASTQEAVVQAQQALQMAKAETEKQVKARERDAEKQILALQKEEQDAENNIQITIDEYATISAGKRVAALELRKAELAGKGVDTSRLTEIEQQLITVQKELEFIEKYRDTIVEYHKDKRELIDKTDEFKAKKQAIEQQYETEELRYQNQHKVYENELSAIDLQIQAFNKQQIQFSDDLEAFNKFSMLPAWARIESIFKEEKDAFKTEKRCKALIDEINSCFANISQRWEDLKDSSNRFVGQFSANNIFSFKTNLSFNEEYLQFAELLGEFVGNSKIEEFERRVNERFASIILSVGKDTGMLMSKSGEIQKVIHEINRDFDSKNFVTAIQKIELRMDESANTVVKLLLLIEAYNKEHVYDIGGLNLFTSVDQDVKNRKAVDLLTQFSRAIANQKSDIIALSDTFELKFRIEENQNDSGWVEKLSNVGSEGTDVLVKAMINIMLLNVFKEGASRKFKDFRLHCMMDEIGKLHPVNVRGILQFANDRNINLINGSPTETNALDYKHIYRLERDGKRNTRIKRILTNHALA